MLKKHQEFRATKVLTVVVLLSLAKNQLKRVQNCLPNELTTNMQSRCHKRLLRKAYQVYVFEVTRQFTSVLATTEV
jgi:hypothetical protein